MSQPPGPARRVRVTSPRTGAARSRRVNPASEIDRRSRLGEIYVTSLLRAQLRLAAGVLSVVGIVVAALPLLFHAVPRLGQVTVLAMPLPWVVLAFALYPFLLACGWFYLRRAERNEAVFAAMVAPAEEPPADGSP